MSAVGPVDTSRSGAVTVDRRLRSAWGGISLVLGISIFAALLWWLSPSALDLAARVTFRPQWLALGLLGSAIASVVTAARWQILAEEMGGTPLPFVSYLHALVFTRFLGQFVPSLAMDLLGRGIALKNVGSSRGLVHTMMQVLVERALDVLQPVLLLLWILVVGPTLVAQGLPLEPGTPLLLCGVAALICLICAPLLRPLTAMTLSAYQVARSFSKRLRRQSLDTGEGHPVDAEVAEFASPPLVLTLQTSLWIAVLSWLRLLTVVLQFFGIAMGVGLSLSLSEITFATQMAQLAGLVGLTPGALGIQEAGWAGAMQLLQQDPVTTSLLILSTRLGMVAFFGSLSLVTWSLWRRYGQIDPAPGP